MAGWLTGKLMRGAGYGIVMDLILGLNIRLARNLDDPTKQCWVH